MKTNAKQWRCGAAVVLGIACAGLVGTRAQAQEGERERGGNWDPSGFLQRLDQNGSGTIEPDEMVGNSGRFIERLGFDRTQPIEIARITEKINQDRRVQSEQQSLQPRRGGFTIPGFGISSDDATVPGFERPRPSESRTPGFQAGGTAETGGGDNGGDSPQLDERARARISERVADVMRRYDGNGDGVLDDEEIGRVPWSDPEPRQFDADRDGKLTATELAARYERRFTEGDRDNRGSRDRRRDDDDDDDDGDRRRRRGNDDNNNGGENRSTSGSGNLAPAAGAPSTITRRSASLDERTVRYVNDVFEKYDANRDNFIDATERGEVRIRLDDADTDGDQQISKGEMLAHFQGGSSSGPTDGSSGRGDPSDRFRGSGGSGENRIVRESGPYNVVRPSGAGSAPSTGQANFLPDDVARYDVNGDGQVQMHEFASKWTEEQVKEFRELDRDNDGIITAKDLKR
jgi:Ca2+-binding EF-hand superfamily protein